MPHTCLHLSEVISSRKSYHTANLSSISTSVCMHTPYIRTNTHSTPLQSVTRSGTHCHDITVTEPNCFSLFYFFLNFYFYFILLYNTVWFCLPLLKNNISCSFSIKLVNIKSQKKDMVLTTILPPGPWLRTLTPSHWFSLLSFCTSAGGRILGIRGGKRRPSPPLPSSHVPPSQPHRALTSLVDVHSVAVSLFQAQGASKETSSAICLLPWQGQSLGSAHQQPARWRRGRN